MSFSFGMSNFSRPCWTNWLRFDQHSVTKIMNSLLTYLSDGCLPPINFFLIVRHMFHSDFYDAMETPLDWSFLLPGAANFKIIPTPH